MASVRGAESLMTSAPVNSPGPSRDLNRGKMCLYRGVYGALSFFGDSSMKRGVIFGKGGLSQFSVGEMNKIFIKVE